MILQIMIKTKNNNLFEGFPAFYRTIFSIMTIIRIF